MVRSLNINWVPGSRLARVCGTPWRRPCAVAINTLVDLIKLAGETPSLFPTVTVCHDGNLDMQCHYKIYFFIFAKYWSSLACIISNKSIWFILDSSPKSWTLEISSWDLHDRSNFGPCHHSGYLGDMDSRIRMGKGRALSGGVWCKGMTHWGGFHWIKFKSCRPCMDYLFFSIHGGKSKRFFTLLPKDTCETVN